MKISAQRLPTNSPILRLLSSHWATSVVRTRVVGVANVGDSLRRLSSLQHRIYNLLGLYGLAGKAGSLLTLELRSPARPATAASPAIIVDGAAESRTDSDERCTTDCSVSCVLYSGADFRSTSSVQVVLWTARGLLAYRTTTPVCRNVVAVRSCVDDCVRRRRRVCRVSAATIERTTVWRPAGPAGSSVHGVANSGRRPCVYGIRRRTTRARF